MNKVPLVARDITKSFKATGGPDVLQGVSLELEQGTTVAITGASGSGKSILLHILSGLAQPDSGTVQVVGVNLAQTSQAQRGKLRNAHIGFVYQFHHLLAEFTALENVALPMLVAGKPRPEAFTAARRLLTDVGLADRADMLPGKLSGGERQRIAIVRALANSPSCVIADEPTGNLDRRAAESVTQLLLANCNAYGCALLIATHDLDLAAQLDHQHELRDGVLVCERNS